MAIRTIFAQRGFSLIEILVAVGLVGGVSLGVTKLIQNMNQGQSQVEAKDDLRTLTNLISTILSNPESCKMTFDENLTPALAAQASTTAGVPYQIIIRAVPTVVNMYTETEQFGKLTIGKYFLKNYDHAKKTAQLEVSAKFKKSSAIEMERSQRIALNMDLDMVTGKVIQCSSANSGQEDIWQFMDIPLKGIFYNQGSVLIGSGAADTSSATPAFAMGTDNFIFGSNSAALGRNNSLSASTSASVALGYDNQIAGATSYAVGGDNNVGTVAADGSHALALGFSNFVSKRNGVAIGLENTVATAGGLAIGNYSSSLGGNSVAIGTVTEASGNFSLGLGTDITASGEKSFALGFNAVASGQNSAVLGVNSTVSGTNSMAFGFNVTASGTNSIAIGRQIENSVANSTMIGTNGSGTLSGLIPSRPDTLLVSHSGGMEICTRGNAIGCDAGYFMEFRGPGGWVYSSDKNIKKDFKKVSSADVMNRLSRLEISSWLYQTDKQNDKRHLGPMAQDFYRLFVKPFGLHGTDKKLSPNQLLMVTTIATQALDEKVKRLERENRNLKSEVMLLKEALCETNPKARVCE